MDDEQNVSEWGAILDGDGRSWVVFEHGTCVVLAEPEGDLAEQARALLEEWGPVRAGTPFGDFTVSHLSFGPQEKGLALDRLIDAYDELMRNRIAA